jgi:hypothetical protein
LPARRGSITPSIAEESHSAPPSTRPSTLPSRSIKLVGSPHYLEGVPDVALWIDIGFDRLEPELGDKRLDDLLPPRSSDTAMTAIRSPEARLQALE